MAQETFKVLALTDYQVVDRLKSIWTDRGSGDDVTLDLWFVADFAPAKVGFQMRDAEKNENVVRFRDSGSSAVHSFHLAFTAIKKLYVDVKRGEDAWCTVVINFPDQIDISNIIWLIEATRRAFSRKGPAAESISAVLGPEMAEFYKVREATLSRLEELNESLVRRTEEYRLQLDRAFEAERKKLEAKLTERAVALEREWQGQNQKLEVQKEELETRNKELDDRSNTHARRKYVEDFKNILRSRAEKFALTKDTSEKRIPIHAVFIVLIVVSLAYAVTNAVELWTNNTVTWDAHVRLLFGFLTTAGALAFYIRWNDKWAQSHADEEFRLRRLDLDIDRASWVVEMALEWRGERGESVPPELVERLTEGLFAPVGGSIPVRHPTEDALSALLGASTTVKLPFMGGEATLDRKGIGRLAAAAEDKTGKS